MMAATILLIDDDKDRRNAILQMMKLNQTLVIEAADCANALPALARKKVDLILLDMTPPSKCGFGILKYLEENLVASKVMVITGTVGVANIIRSAPTGDLDKAASKEGLAEIAALGADLKDYTVLIDLREVKSRLSSTDVFELASELAKYGETFRRRTAVLARADHDLDQATFFE